MEKNENFKEELENQYSILIKASEKKEKKYFIIIISILAITMVATLISCIFAGSAFRASKKINEKQEETINTYYKTLSIELNDGPTLDLKGIGNGYELRSPKTITITNNGDQEVTFNIKLGSIKTSLLSTSNLKYTIVTNNESSTPKDLPLSEKTIISDIKLEPEQTVKYIIKASYTGQMEENDYTNYYSAQIIIEPVGDIAQIQD